MHRRLLYRLGGSRTHASRGSVTSDRRSRTCLERSQSSILRLLVVALLVQILVACGPGWSAEIVLPGQDPITVTEKVLRTLAPFEEKSPVGDSVPLERVLVHVGAQAVETIDVDGRTFSWDKAHDHAWWCPGGQLHILDEALTPNRIEVHAPVLLSEVSASIMDIAPTVAYSLGLPAPKEAQGTTLDVPRADRAFLLFLDGLGYVLYQKALVEDAMPRLGALGEAQVALTVYPPVTSVSSAALLTGAPPEVNGAVRRGIRKTDLETVFDVVKAAGRRGVAVEGSGLSFNLRSAELILSGDLDGNGTATDNVLANTMRVLQGGAPDLFWVHFHGIDDVGHTYGPDSPEWMDKVTEVDEAIGQIWEALPLGTLVIAFADHGMHPVDEAGRLGNHNSLLAVDSFIPLIIALK